MQKLTVILAAAATLLALTQAHAQVPTLNIEKTCRAAQPLLGNDNIDTNNTGNTNNTNNAGNANNTNGNNNANNTANLGNTGAANTYESCMQSETAARKSAIDLWDKVKASDRNNCVGLSKMVYPSYVELLSCLQMYAPTPSGGVTPTDQNPPAAGVRRPLHP